MKIFAYNVEGLKSALSENSFVNYIKLYDIIILTETWSQNYDKDLLQDYIHYCVRGYKKGSRGHHNGGISIFVKNVLAPMITNCKKVDNSIFLIFKNHHIFNCINPVIVGGCYLPPEGSTYYDNKNGPETLEETITELTKTYNDPYLLIFGDFKARTGRRDDFIYDDTSDNLPIDDWYHSNDFKIPQKVKR